MIESVIDQYKHLAETIKHINSGCQIIISSILPRKNDKLANQLITQTNQSLKQLCESKSYHFLDNTEKFPKNGAPDTIVYKDNIHLNTKGGKVLRAFVTNLVMY